MPIPGVFKLPAAALRRATIATTQLPFSQTRAFGSRQTQYRLAKIAQMTATFGISGSVIYFYDDITRFVSGEPTEEEKKELERARLKPQKAVINLQAAPAAGTLSAIPKSWDQPGLYLWGLNTNMTADPTAGKKKDRDTRVATPRRLAYFDGQVLRDVKLRKDFGVAVTEKGDVVEWGKGFDNDSPSPEVVLSGKNITQVAVSNDRIIALSAKGEVYSLPAARTDQKETSAEPTPGKKAWMPSLWASSNENNTQFRTITPAGLPRGEHVTSIASGTDHCLLLTSAGRLFSAASSTTAFPAHGQLGIPGLRWETRPEAPYYQAHEVKGLAGKKIIQIAAGAQHSVALTDNGQAYAFGDNMFGQLGFANPYGTTLAETPTRIGTAALYGRNSEALFSGVYAGGFNTFLAVESQKDPGATDIWAAGQGQLGSLGTGKWLHMTSTPSRVKGLSRLWEYSEADECMLPIRAGQISVGATHVAAVLEGTGSVKGPRDVVVWGGNENYQLGTGKRSNMCAPTNIPAVDTMEGQLQRLQTPERGWVVKVGEKGRKVKTVQKVECGEFVSALYTAPE